MPLDRLAAAGDPQLRRILLDARARRGPFTAEEVGTAIGVHRNVARARLDRLDEAGFLSVTLERRGERRGPGAGRPAKVYRVAPELEGVEFPDRRYAELIGLLLEKIPAGGRERALRTAGEEFGRRVAAAAGLKASADIRSGIERVCDALGALGFQVVVEAVERERVVLTTPTCPLRPLVGKQTAAVEIDRGMWAGLIERGVRGVSAEDVACELPQCRSRTESCRIDLSLGGQGPAGGGDRASR